MTRAVLTTVVALALGAQAEAPRAAAVVLQGGLARPSAVFYDPATDTYLVGNVSGTPGQKDGDGFISEFAPDGALVKAKLVEGGANKVTLHAPTGLAVVGGLLCVADIDVVRLFDRATGAPKGEVKVSGATFVDQLAVGPDGKLYLSDAGLDSKAEPTGTDGLYLLELGKRPVLKTLLKARHLHHPSGLAVTKDALWLVSAGAAELFTVDLKGRQRGPPTTLPKGHLEGLVAVAEGDLLISSRDGAAVYRGSPGGPFVEVVTQLRAPAGLGYDSKRRRVLVAHPQDDLVDAWDLP